MQGTKYIHKTVYTYMPTFIPTGNRHWDIYEAWIFKCCNFCCSTLYLFTEYLSLIALLRLFCQLQCLFFCLTLHRSVAGSPSLSQWCHPVFGEWTCFPSHSQFQIYLAFHCFESLKYISLFMTHQCNISWSDVKLKT